MNQRPYQRLKASRRGLFVRGTLWLADDHLLSVSSTRFRDQYLRYYFTDIQAFTVRQTSNLTLWPLLVEIFAVALPFLLFGYWAPKVAAICAAPILLFVLINRSLGPRCQVNIITRVGQDRIVALSRLKESRRVLAQIREIIEAKQGVLDIQMIGNTVAGQVGSATAQQIAQARPATARTPLTGPSWLPYLTYGGFFVLAGLILWATISASYFIDLGAIIVSSLLLGALVWLLVLQLMRTRSISAWLVPSLGLIALTVLPIYLYVITLIAIAQMKTPPRDADIYSIWRQHSSFPLSLYISGGIFAGLGMLGILLTLIQRQQPREAAQ